MALKLGLIIGGAIISTATVAAMTVPSPMKDTNDALSTPAASTPQSSPDATQTPDPSTTPESTTTPLTSPVETPQSTPVPTATPISTSFNPETGQSMLYVPDDGHDTSVTVVIPTPHP